MILPNGLQISLPHPTPNPGGTMCPYQSLQRRNPRTWKQATLGSSPRPCLHINILQKSLSRQNMSFSNILLFQMNLPQTSSTARNSSRSQLKEMQVILQTCLTTKTHLGVIWELNLFCVLTYNNWVLKQWMHLPQGARVLKLNLKIVF